MTKMILAEAIAALKREDVDLWMDAQAVVTLAAQKGDLIPKADAAEAEVARLRSLVRRVVEDPVWRTNDNTLWPDLCAALTPQQDKSS